MKKIRSWSGRPLVIFSLILILSIFVQNVFAQNSIIQAVQNAIGKAFISEKKVVVSDSTSVGQDTGFMNTVLWGSTVRLRHKNTNKYLATGDEKLTHFRTSGQPAVYATDGKNDSQLWIIKGMHSADRWNVPFNYHVRCGDIIRLENVKTGRNLHSHGGHPSPASNQQEATSLGTNGVCDSNDNWRVDWVSGGSRGVMVAGSIIRLVHQNTNHALHSHANLWFREGKQEVTGFGGRDGNDEFVIELEQSPAQSDITKNIWQSHRGGTLNYNTIIFIYPISTADDRGLEAKRFWTHGGSRHGDGNAEPHNHLELLAGCPGGDVRSATAPALFIIQNVDNPIKTGPIKYGDKLKIVSLFSGAGHPPKSGPLNPFKYWWLNEDSRWGKAHHEIVISHPDHPSVKDAHSHFVIEPTYPGVSGDVYQNDLIQIRSLFGNKDILWMHWVSRFGGNYWEVLGNNGDPWGKQHVGSGVRGRDGLFHRLRINHVMRAWLPGFAQADFDRIAESIKLSLGAEAAKQEVELEKAKVAQLKVEKERAEAAAKAAQEEAKRLTETAAKQLAEAKALVEKTLQEAKSKDAEAQKKAQEGAAALLKATEERLKKEKEEAVVAAQKAKELAGADAQKREEARNAKFDPEAAEKQRKLDEATALNEELKFVTNLPVGFVKVPGKAKKLAVGLREEMVAGKKKEVIDRWAIGMDNKLMIGTDAINPWTVHVAKDDKGSDLAGFKDVAVGGDGTVYAIAIDGKVYQYVRPGEKVVKPAEKKPEKSKKLRGKAKRVAKKASKKSAKKSAKKIVKKSAKKAAVKKSAKKAGKGKASKERKSKGKSKPAKKSAKSAKSAKAKKAEKAEKAEK